MKPPYHVATGTKGHAEIHDANGLHIASTPLQGTAARYIAACLSKFAGMPLEAVESMPSTVAELGDLYREESDSADAAKQLVLFIEAKAASDEDWSELRAQISANRAQRANPH